MRLTEFIFEGITHLEDLPIEQFINSIRKLNQFEITEKIDGANLHFGVDEAGKFYTSREGKGGNRFYDYTNWGNKFKDTGFKSAHLALEKISKNLLSKKLINLGDQIEVEILFGALPNTVPYTGDINQIIILRPVNAADNIDELNKRLDKIKQVLEGVKVAVNVDEVPFTSDGIKVDHRQEKHVWAVSQTPKVDKKLLDTEFLNQTLEKKLSKLEDFLYADSEIGKFSNLEILALPLNKRPESVPQPEWKGLVPLVKTKKTNIIEKVKTLQLDIKEELLNKLVRNVSSEFGPDLADGGWVEGLVFRDPSTNEMFKLIDKDVFTAMNKFNWKIRNLIRSTSVSSKISDVNGRIVKQMADSISTPELGRAITAKKHLRSLKASGQNPIETIAQKFDFAEIKSKWAEIITHHMKLLDRLYSWYEENRTKLSFSTGGEISKTSQYSGGVDERTKQSFAEMRQEYERILSEVKSAKSPEELVTIFVGEKLSSLGESRIVTEGGNAFDGVGAIHIDEIRPTIYYLSEIIGVNYNEIINYTLGSVNKAEFSGDMDVALQEFTPDEQAEFVEKIEGKLGKENVKKMPLLITIKLPIQEYDANRETSKPRTGNVQVDLIFGDRDWNKFYYHSAGDASKYKGMHRNLIIAAIAKNMVESMSDEKDSFGRPIEIVRYIFSPTNGLVKIKRTSKKNKKGEWIKGQDTEQISKPIKTPDMIAKIMFGKGATSEIFNSLETLTDAVIKYIPNKKQQIFRDFIHGLPEEQRNYDFPEEIEKVRNK